MRGRYTIKHYQMDLTEYSIGSHVCANVVLSHTGIFSSLKIHVLCDNISAFQTSTDRGFMVIIIGIRFFSILILPLLNETLVYSRRKKKHWALNDPLYQSCYNYGR